MKWLITLFELIRDKFEEWQLNRIEGEVAELELTVPYEEKVAKKQIELLGLQTEVATTESMISTAEAKTAEAKLKSKRLR